VSVHEPSSPSHRASRAAPAADGLCCAGGHKDIVAALLAAGANVSAQNKQGATPLHFAAGEQRLQQQ
jgi:ankyrin repeat protein